MDSCATSVLRIGATHGANFGTSEAALQRAWEQIIVLLPKGDPRATDANDQALRSFWRKSDIWELVKETDRNFGR